MNQYDVIVIGGGPSGMMAAYTAAKNKASCLLIERNETLGKKLLLTGGGRCNVTNNDSMEDLIAHIPGNGRFLYSSLSSFSNKDIMQFFETNGVSLKEEDHGRIFPTTNSSKTILNCLLQVLKEVDVTIQYNTNVTSLIIENNEVKGVTTNHNETIYAKSIILATGGKSFPVTGSTGDGYRFAKSANHTITDLYPTEVPLLSNEPFIQKGLLQGLSLQDIELSVLNKKGKVVVTHRMDLLFTHFGISGPAALRCSSFYHTMQKRDKSDIVTLCLNALPDQTKHTLKCLLQSYRKEAPKKEIKTHLKTLLPERYVEFILDQIQLDPKLHINQLNEPQLDSLIDAILNFKFTVNGTLPLAKSFVTGGGIQIKEVDPKTMASKLCIGLYICGEVLDINGYTGGYNITVAFTTGHCAGYHASLNV